MIFITITALVLAAIAWKLKNDYQAIAEALATEMIKIQMANTGDTIKLDMQIDEETLKVVKL